MIPEKAVEKAKQLYHDPLMLARALGYKSMRPIHAEWMRQMLTGTEDMTLQAHRGSYKTTCLCIVIALLMVRYRNRNIIFLRKTDSDIAEVVKNVHRIIENPTFTAMVKAITGSEQFGVISCNTSEITLSCYSAPRGAAQLLGIGIGGSLTGKHADIIITDDIVNLKDRVSKAERERTKAVYMELQNIRNPGGRIINTGTPWHRDDAFSIMPNIIRYDCYQTGMIDRDQLEALRRSMSPSLFAANYELRHIASDNELFSAAPETGVDPDMLRDGIAHIDAAYGGEDYTAFTCGIRIGDTLYIYGRLWHKHVDTVLSAIVAKADELMCAPIYLETNADKGYLGKQIRNMGGQVHLYTERMNKFQKIASYGHKWWPSVKFIDGTDPEYIQQIQDYTEDAEHDDAPDSFSCVARRFDRETIF